MSNKSAMTTAGNMLQSIVRLSVLHTRHRTSKIVKHSSDMTFGHDMTADTAISAVDYIYGKNSTPEYRITAYELVSYLRW